MTGTIVNGTTITILPLQMLRFLAGGLGTVLPLAGFLVGAFMRYVESLAIWSPIVMLVGVAAGIISLVYGFGLRLQVRPDGSLILNRSVLLPNRCVDLNDLRQITYRWEARSRTPMYGARHSVAVLELHDHAGGWVQYSPEVWRDHEPIACVLYDVCRFTRPAMDDQTKRRLARMWADAACV